MLPFLSQTFYFVLIRAIMSEVGVLTELKHSVATKLFFVLVVILGIAFLGVLLNNIRNYTNHSYDQVLKNAVQISNIIKSACYDSMLKNDREGLASIIASIGRQEGVEGIRIYNREGRISFSKDEEELHKIVDKKAEQCIVCHREEPAKGLVPTKDLARTLLSSQGYRQLAVVNPIENSPECYGAPCHAHPRTAKKLGLLDVKLSLKKIDEDIARTKRRMVVYSILLIFFSAFLTGGFIILFVHKPIKDLIKGVREVARLNLDYKVAVKSRDEFGELAYAFNEMTDELRQAHDSLKEWANTLEDKVREKTEELKKAQTHIIMTEKMASLGKLSAAVAHEINNPIFGILSYAKLTQRYLDELKNNPELFEQVKENLRFIGEEAKRCGEIVRNLLIFAKKSTGEFKEEHLSELVKVAINLVEHGARMKKVDIVKELDSPDDLIYADANAIIQAFVAFLVNAIEAVAEGGVVKVGIASSDESIKVMIADNGRGISEDVLPHIFEPFFTTKENRKSIGMGLSIAYSIVDQHGGKIEVKSRVNEGTTFTVYLPRHMRDSHHL